MGNSHPPPLAQFFALQACGRSAKLREMYACILSRLMECFMAKRGDAIASTKRGSKRNCHPKNQWSVDRDQLTVTRSRGVVDGVRRAARGEERRLSVEIGKTATQKTSGQLTGIS